MADLETATVKYGRRKLDEDAYSKQQAEKPYEGREGTRYGPRKGLADAPAATSAPKTDEGKGNTPPAESTLSLSKLEAALEKRPELLDSSIAIELRQPAPRKGALTLFLELERAKNEQARPDVIENLEAALAALD